MPMDVAIISPSHQTASRLQLLWVDHGAQGDGVRHCIAVTTSRSITEQWVLEATSVDQLCHERNIQVNGL